MHFCKFVSIREDDRDALRFHWLKDLTTREVETLRFTRALFGLSTSPFLLGGVIEQHLQNMQSVYPREVDEIRRSLYVDDLISGGTTVEKTEHLKKSCVTIFGEAKFDLHKWHSNNPALEAEIKPLEAEIKPLEAEIKPLGSEIKPLGAEIKPLEAEIKPLEVETKLLKTVETSYAKEQLGVKPGETSLLGVPWDKEKDTIKVNFPDSLKEITKRNVLGNIAEIYDPLGLVSPTTLQGINL